MKVILFYIKIALWGGKPEARTQVEGPREKYICRKGLKIPPPLNYVGIKNGRLNINKKIRVKWPSWGGGGWSEVAMREFAFWCRTDTCTVNKQGILLLLKCFLFYISRKLVVHHSPSVPTLQRYLNLCIPRKGIGLPQSQFPHLCVCEWSIYSHILSTSFPAAEYADRSEEYINRSQKHECRNCNSFPGNSYFGFSVLCLYAIFFKEHGYHCATSSAWPEVELWFCPRPMSLKYRIGGSDLSYSICLFYCIMFL